MRMKRKIKGIYPAVREDIGDLITYRVMPTSHISMIDPFLFLNHHGHQVYPPQNHGLPFGPHPHRGFETVTFILEGDIFHQDSDGHESIIQSGGVQWMTAGRGLIHSETSSPAFKSTGGPLEILQLWVNLPRSLKMTSPQYTGLTREELPVYSADNGQVKVQLITGEWNGHIGPFVPLTDVTSMIMELQNGSRTSLRISSERNIFFYVIKGHIRIQDEQVNDRHLVDFEKEGELLEITCEKESKILLCHALPLSEPVVSYGPFVMNTREEILKAIKDYESGKFTHI